MLNRVITKIWWCKYGAKCKNKNHNLLKINKLRFLKVIRSGFEPETHSLEGCCSIQLSYQTIIFGCKGSENRAKYKIKCDLFLFLIPEGVECGAAIRGAFTFRDVVSEYE